MLVLLLGSKTLFGGLVLKFQRNWSNVIKTVALQKEQSKDSIMRTKFPGPLVMEKLKEKRASLVAQRLKRLPGMWETRPGSIPGSERSPGEGNGNPLQYTCLENSLDLGAW